MHFLISSYMIFLGWAMWEVPAILYLNVLFGVFIAAQCLYAIFDDWRDSLKMPALTAWLLVMLSVLISHAPIGDYFITRGDTGQFIVNPNWLHLTTWGVALIFALYAWQRRGINWLRGYTLIGFAVYATGIICALTGTLPENALGGNVTYVMALFVVLLPLGMELRHKKLCLAYHILGLINIFFVVGLRNRTGLVSLAVVGMLYARQRYAAYLSPQAYRAAKRVIAAVALVLMVLLIAYRPNSVLARGEWQAQAVDTWLGGGWQRFWFGIGMGNTWLQSAYHANDGASFTHLFPLTVALEQGMCGLMALTALIFALYRSRSQRSAGANWALVMFGVFSLFNEPFWFWQFPLVLGGMSYGIVRREREHLLQFVDGNYQQRVSRGLVSLLGTLRGIVPITHHPK